MIGALRLKTSYNHWAFRVYGNGITFAQLVSCAAIALFVVSFFAAILAHDVSTPGARSASCMSNEKQLGLAMLGYAEDYDGKLPTGLQSSNTDTAGTGTASAPHLAAQCRGHSLGIGWAGCLYGYVKSTSVFKCPEDKTETPPVATAVALNPVSYSLNQWLPGRAVSALAHSESTILVFESSGTLVNLGSQSEQGSPEYSAVGDGDSDAVTGEPALGDAYDTPRGLAHIRINLRGKFARHHIAKGGHDRAGAIYLLADGHAKFLHFEQVSCGSDALRQGQRTAAIRASFNPNP